MSYYMLSVLQTVNDFLIVELDKRSFRTSGPVLNNNTKKRYKTLPI